MPYLAILAASVWVSGWNALSARWHESSTGKIALAFSCLAVILLLTNWGVELARDWDKIAQLLGPNGNQTHFPY